MPGDDATQRVSRFPDTVLTSEGSSVHSSSLPTVIPMECVSDSDAPLVTGHCLKSDVNDDQGLPDPHSCSEVGPLKSSSAGVSASRRNRLKRRYSDLKLNKISRQTLEVMANSEGEIKDSSGRNRRGTYLVAKIPNTKAYLTSTLSTVSFGVLVERAPHLGWALKAQRLFPKNSYITQYEGSVITKNETLQDGGDSDRTHYFGLGSTLVIDGLKDPVRGRGGGSFANHSDQPNAVYFKLGGVVYLRAKSEILPGQWITVSYGDRFLSTSGKAIHGDI